MCLPAQFFSWIDVRLSDGPGDPPFEMKWAALVNIAAEIDAFAPILLSDEGAAPLPTISMLIEAAGGPTPTWLAARARWAANTTAGSTQNDYYLFVVNDGNGCGLVTFSNPSSIGDIGAGGVEVRCVVGTSPFVCF